MILVGAILLSVFYLPDAWDLPVIVVAGLIEAGETLFWLWLSRRGRVQMGPETIVGGVAVVVAPCTPVGRVRFQGELWQARCAEGAEVGERVRVRALEGLTLVVERGP